MDAMRPGGFRTAVLGLLLAGAGPAQEEVRLFNGKDLSNFYTFLAGKGRDQDPEGVFTVADGMIRVSGQEYGYLATREEFENYELTVEFKWGPKTWPPREKAARDNGILFHMQGPDKIWPRSVEFQIIEGGTGDILCVDGASIAYQADYAARLAAAPAKMLSPDGLRVVKGRVNWPGRARDWKDVLGFRGPADLEKPVGEWNTLVLTCRDGAFEYRVNGALVARGTGAEPRRGRILLQSEGAETFFRRIALRVIS